MSELPIIRIEIEGMRQSIVAAMMDRQIQMDSHVNDSIKRYVESGQMAADIDRIVLTAIQEAVKSTAESYFKYGDGRKVIIEAVATRLGQEPTP